MTKNQQRIKAATTRPRIKKQPAITIPQNQESSSQHATIKLSPRDHATNQAANMRQRDQESTSHHSTKNHATKNQQAIMQPRINLATTQLRINQPPPTPPTIKQPP
jgi:hypothetical protein